MGDVPDGKQPISPDLKIQTRLRHVWYRLVTMIVIGCFLASYSSLQDELVRRFGVSGVGTVTNSVAKYETHSRGNGSWAYYLEFEYMVSGGRVMHGRKEFDRTGYDVLKRGQQVPIRYLADSPSLVALNEYYAESRRELRRMPFICLFTIGLALGVGLIVSRATDAPGF